MLTPVAPTGAHGAERRSTVTNGRTVASLYAALGRGDVSALLAGLDETIEWVVPAGLHYGGTYRGRQAVLDNVFARFTTDWRDFRVTPQEIIDAGDRVVSLGHYAGVSVGTDKTMTARFAHVWWFRDGVPVRFETVLDTHAMVSALT
jgi:ketosteroid isomerase-like protein